MSDNRRIDERERQKREIRTAKWDQSEITRILKAMIERRDKMVKEKQERTVDFIS